MNAEKVQKGVKLLKIFVFFAIIAGIPLYMFIVYPDFAQTLLNREAFGTFLIERKEQNAIIYIAIIFVITLVAVIPSQVVHLVGGFIFGVAFSLGLTVAGTAMGMLVAFLISKHFGREFVILVFKEKRVNSFVNAMNTSKGYIVVFLVYLIPGIPKDVFTYAAGLTKLKAIPFTLMAAAARTPAQFATLLIASFMRKGDYIGICIVVVVVTICLIALFINRKRFFAFLGKIGRKVSSEDNL